MKRLDGRTALITGGTSGFGYAMADLFSREGAQVVITGRGKEKGLNAVKKIKDATGFEIKFLPCDVAKESQVRELVEETLRIYQRIDVLVSNAGYFAWKEFEETTEDEWNRMMDTNLKGCFNCCKYAAPHMIENRKGSIIITSSVVGLSGKAYVPAYSAAKGGLTLLAKSLALRYAKYNVRVNCICPGTIITDINRERVDKASNPEQALKNIIAEYPLGRLGIPMDIAHAALFLASDESQWVTGVALPVDGGYSAGK